MVCLQINPYHLYTAYFGSLRAARTRSKIFEDAELLMIFISFHFETIYLTDTFVDSK